MIFPSIHCWFCFFLKLQWCKSFIAHIIKTSTKAHLEALEAANVFGKSLNWCNEQTVVVQWRNVWVAIPYCKSFKKIWSIQKYMFVYFFWFITTFFFFPFFHSFVNLTFWNIFWYHCQGNQGWYLFDGSFCLVFRNRSIHTTQRLYAWKETVWFFLTKIYFVFFFSPPYL